MSWAIWVPWPSWSCITTSSQSCRSLWDNCRNWTGSLLMPTILGGSWRDVWVAEPSSFCKSWMHLRSWIWPYLAALVFGCTHEKSISHTDSLATMYIRCSLHLTTIWIEDANWVFHKQKWFYKEEHHEGMFQWNGHSRDPMHWREECESPKQSIGMVCLPSRTHKIITWPKCRLAYIDCLVWYGYSKGVS